MSTALLGVLAMEVVPALRDGRERDRAKRTADDIRVVATAVESYSIDNCAYLAVGRVDVAVLAPLLEPTYVKELPVVDGWSSPLRFRGSARAYEVVSWGSDRRAGGDDATATFRSDFVFDTGSFVQIPAEALP